VGVGVDVGVSTFGSDVDAVVELTVDSGITDAVGLDACGFFVAGPVLDGVSATVVEPVAAESAFDVLWVQPAIMTTATNRTATGEQFLRTS
jgi:hypothetical protein